MISEDLRGRSGLGPRRGWTLKALCLPACRVGPKSPWLCDSPQGGWISSSSVSTGLLKPWKKGKSVYWERTYCCWWWKYIPLFIVLAALEGVWYTFYRQESSLQVRRPGQVPGQASPNPTLGCVLTLRGFKFSCSLRLDRGAWVFSALSSKWFLGHVSSFCNRPVILSRTTLHNTSSEPCHICTIF